MFENDYNITGKHATYLKFLAAKNSGSRDDDEVSPTSAKIFERYIDVYMNAAIWGLLYKRTAPRDTSSDDRARIYADAYANERENCVFLYRMVLLLDKTTQLAPTERVDRAFRYDTQENKKEEFVANMELFHSYVRGGIEEMYEQFTDGCSTRDDYMNKVYEIMTAFKQEISGISYEDELAKLIR
ncbi:MAG: hypothetical protein LUE63_04485 [Lachnospiraceae bacterium]|nr:hypothetical protein [Lachnospiraceae bacterium]